jgi:hypothetical protein
MQQVAINKMLKDGKAIVSASQRSNLCKTQGIASAKNASQ